jgi:hypothetical protein
MCARFGSAPTMPNPFRQQCDFSIRSVNGAISPRRMKTAGIVDAARGRGYPSRRLINLSL